jgi:hypothetical protein
MIPQVEFNVFDMLPIKPFEDCPYCEGTGAQNGMVCWCATDVFIEFGPLAYPSETIMPAAWMNCYPEMFQYQGATRV